MVRPCQLSHSPLPHSLPERERQKPDTILINQPPPAMKPSPTLPQKPLGVLRPPPQRTLMPSRSTCSRSRQPVSKRAAPFVRHICHASSFRAQQALYVCQCVLVHVRQRKRERISLSVCLSIRALYCFHQQVYRYAYIHINTHTHTHTHTQHRPGMRTCIVCISCSNTSIFCPYTCHAVRDTSVAHCLPALVRALASV